MAMNKSERAEMEALRNCLALARALRFPDYPVPSPLTYEEIKSALVSGGERWGSPQKVARGWFYHAYLGAFSGPPRPTYGCSNGISHNASGDTTSTQNAGRMFRTELEAAQALRHELTTQCAVFLAKVDRFVEEASAESPAQPTAE